MFIEGNCKALNHNLLCLSPLKEHFHYYDFRMYVLSYLSAKFLRKFDFLFISFENTLYLFLEVPFVLCVRLKISHVSYAFLKN